MSALPEFEPSTIYAQPNTLTPREIQLTGLQALEHISLGLSPQAIAQEHAVSSNLIRYYAAEVANSLGAKSHAHAVRRGFEAGLLVPSTPVPETAVLPTYNLDFHESETLRLLSLGYSKYDMGILFNRSANTIANYRNQLRRKFGSNSGPHLVRLAIETHQLAIGPEDVSVINRHLATVALDHLATAQ